MFRLQQQDRLRDLCPRVLDVLALIQNHIMKRFLGEKLDVVAHDGVSGQDELMFLSL